MRIAAGVLLIIAGIFNGIAGSGYALGGAAAGAAGIAADEMMKEAAKGNTEMTAEQKAQLEKAQADLKGATAAGSGLLAFGFFLLAMLGLQIAGGVVLFMRKAAGFAMVVGVLGILAEVGGSVLTAFGIMNIFGIVASVLCILAAKGLKAEAGGGAARA